MSGFCVNIPSMKRVFEIDEIDSVALDLLETIKTSADSDSATLVALSGELGAGKTTLTQAFAKACGITESVLSPTFVLMRIYKIDEVKSQKIFGRVFEHLIHIDAYRIDDEKELLTLGWQEMLKEKNNLILIEWPERAGGIIPKNSINVSLSHKGEKVREIEIEKI